MNGVDFVNELKARGFSGFTPDQLLQYTNWGYREVARRSRWDWLETNDDVSLAAGEYSTALSTISQFKSLRSVYALTPTSSKLSPITRGVFLSGWLNQDLGNATRRATTGYIIWGQLLYLLPPTDVARTFTVYYYQDVADLKLTTAPISPTDFDEAILTAARWRCHIRAQEFDLANVAKQDLEDQMFRFLDQETYESEEHLDRTSPDDTWL